MACNNCKKNNQIKQQIKEDLIKSSEFVSKGVIWFVVIWSLLAVYGLYTLIVKII